MNKPRIYIAIATFHPLVGGAEKQALLQGKSMQARGFPVSIITFHYDKSSPKRDKVEGVPVIRIAGTLLGNRQQQPRLLQRLCYLLSMVVMGWKLWQHRKHYDILHVYQLNLLALPTAIVCRLTGKRLIIAVRCADSDQAASQPAPQMLLPGTLDANTPWLQITERTTSVGDLWGLERFGQPIVRITYALMRQISAVIVILSSRMYRYLEAHNFMLPDTQLIPNGVDTRYFQPVRENTMDEQKLHTVICVSRLSYQKGHDILLHAWRIVHQQMPEARLILVGKGPIEAQLKRLSQELSLNQSIEFTGLQDNIPAQLHCASIAVLPSRWEGMPNAVLEAMACGLACVATAISGSEDIIQSGINGLLVEPENYQELAQALLALLRQPHLLQHYGKAGRETVEAYYSLEHITDIYEELYQRVFSEKQTLPLQESIQAPV